MASKRQLSTIISLLVITSLLLAACGGTETPTATPATPTAGRQGQATQAATQPPAAEATNTTAASGGTGGSPKIKNPDTMVVGAPGDPQSLDPAWEYDTASATVVF